MAFDVVGARKAGYSDAEIAEFLGAQSRFDVAAARRAGYNDAEILQHLTSATPPSAPERVSSVPSEALFGGKQLAAAGRGAVASLIGDPNQAVQNYMASQEAARREAGVGPSLERIGQVAGERGVIPAAGEVLTSEVPRAIAGQAANLALLGTAAAVGGKTLGPAGLFAGPAAVSFPQHYIENLAQQARAQQEKGEPVDVNRLTAAAAAVPQTALDVGALYYTLGKRVITSLFGRAGNAAVSGTGAAATAARQEITERVAKLAKEAGRTVPGGVARGVAAESGTEVVQAMVQRYQAGQDLFSPDALADYAENAYGGALVGGPMGGLGTVASRAGARRELAAEERDRATEQLLRDLEAAAPEAVAPEAVAPEAVAPEAVAPEVAAPEAVAPEVAAPEAVAPEAVAPEAVAPEAVAPEAVVPEAAPITRETVTPEMLEQAGLPQQPRTAQQKGVASWARENLVGQPLETLPTLVERNPDLVKGQGLRAQVLRNLLAATPVPEFQEAPRAEAPVAPPSVPADTDLVGGEPSVGVPVPGGRSGPLVGEPPVQPAAPVVAGVEDAAPAAPVGAVPQGEQPAAVAQAEPVRRAVEPPVRENLAPEKERELRRKLAAQRQQLSVLEAQRDQVAREYEIAELTGNEATQAALAPALENARRAMKKATADADRTYWRIYDKDAADRQAEIGKQLFEADEAARDARQAADMSVPLRKRRGEYPYNLKTLQAVHDELRDQLSHTPEYKEFIEKNFTLDRSRVKNKVNEAKVIEEGQQLLDRMVFQKGAAGPEIPLPADIIQALRDNNISDALAQLADSSDIPLVKALATRLSPLLVNTRVTIVNDLRNAKTKNPAAGAASSNGLTVWLDATRGMNVETLLHESVHAGTERVIASAPRSRTPQQNAAVRELTAIWEAAKQSQDVRMEADARESLSEFAAEALTNPILVQDLSKVPWRIGDAWAGFKRAILRMLGISDPQTMLDNTIAALDTIFVRPMPGVEPKTTEEQTESGAVPAEPAPTDPDIRYQLTPLERDALVNMTSPAAKEAALAAMRTIYPTGLGRQGAIAADQIALDTKIRTYVTDKAATVFDKINRAASEKQIDALKALRTKAAFKQAEASHQLVPEFLRTGELVITTPDGPVQVGTGGTRPPPTAAMDIIYAWGKRNNLTNEQARDVASKLLESARQKDFRDYNATKAPNEPSLPVSMSDAEINRLTAILAKEPDLLAARAVLEKSRVHLIDLMVKVGRITKDVGDAWKANPSYMPFDRVRTPEDTKFRPRKRVGRGLSVLGGLPELVDAPVVTRPVGNVLDNYFALLGWQVEQIVRTRATNLTIQALRKFGHARFRGLARPGNATQARTIEAYRKGQKVYYEVPTPLHALAFRADVVPTMPLFATFAQISRFLRSTITLVPTFAAGQLPMDVQRAIFASGVKNPALVSARILSNFAVMSKMALQGELYKVAPELAKRGVVGGVDYRPAAPAESLMQELGYRPYSALGSKKLGSLLHRLSELSRAGDIAVREAIYHRTKEEGGSEELAQYRAREIINFNTRGAGDRWGVSQAMTQTIPFFNAYLQGTDVYYRTLTGRDAPSGLPQRQALTRLGFFTGGALALGTMYALTMSGDEEYENMNLDERDRSWILGNGFSIPVASEIGMIFKAIPERVVEYYKRAGTPEEQTGIAALGSWFRAAMTEYVLRMTPVPAAIKPILENVTNYSWFTGRPLEGFFQQTLDPSRSINTTTSELAKSVSAYAADVFNVELSPIKLDNLLRGYFGTTASLGLMAVDALLNPDKMDRPLHQIAGLGHFTYNTIGTRRKDEFYDLREKVVRAQNTFNQMIQNDPERAEAYAMKNQEKLMLYRAVNDTLQDLSKTRDYLRFLNSAEAAKEMTQEERRKEADEVRRMEQEIVEWVREARSEFKL